MLSKEVETFLNRALAAARERRQAVAGVDHLLYVLLEDSAVADALFGCNVNARRARDLLGEHINGLDRQAQAGEVDNKPSMGFQRGLQRAAIQIQAAGLSTLSTVDLLLGLLGEHDAFGIRLLEREGATAVAIQTLLRQPPHNRT